MKFLCKIGLHKWKDTGKLGSLVVPVNLEQCFRCKIIRQFALYGYVYFKPTQETHATRTGKL